MVGDKATDRERDLTREERSLTEAYRTTKNAPAPQGQGLNDLYVRFFRMAERRIVEMGKPAKGVVCYISNYSWLDGLSFTGMRERYLEAFDKIWVDCLNGDKYKTGKVTPDGKPDPSIFSTEYNREGIQVGTAIGLMVRKEKHKPAGSVAVRHFWGKDKRADLRIAAEKTKQAGYEKVVPVNEMGLSILSTAVGKAYFHWPLLPDLYPTAFPGVKTSRDDFVIAIERSRLVERMERYFNPTISNDEIHRENAGIMTETPRFKAAQIRQQLCKRGVLSKNFVRYCYRPFDIRWLYWEPITKLLDEKRDDYIPHVFPGNFWLEARQKQPMENFDRGLCVKVLSDQIGNGMSSFFPLYLSGAHVSHGLFDGPPKTDKVPNLSDMATAYLSNLKVDGPEPLFFHALAVLHAPAYRIENAGALRQDWPRIPLPGTKKALEASANLGRELAALLDPESAVKGVTVGAVRGELKVLGAITKVGATAGPGGSTLNPDAGDLAVTAGWGHGGKDGAVMPGRGRTVARSYTPAELTALNTAGKDALALLGDTCVDVYLNDTAYWRCVPLNVWEYTLGGYQVLKKWLSYREKALLGRDLTMDEVREVTNIVRRVTAILLMSPALDAIYTAISMATAGGKGS